MGRAGREADHPQLGAILRGQTCPSAPTPRGCPLAGYSPDGSPGAHGPGTAERTEFARHRRCAPRKPASVASHTTGAPAIFVGAATAAASHNILPRFQHSPPATTRHRYKPRGSDAAAAIHINTHIPGQHPTRGRPMPEPGPPCRSGSRSRHSRGNLLHAEVLEWTKAWNKA